MEKENELKKFGNVLNTGWKVVTALIIIISGITSVVLAWVQIQTNTVRIDEVEAEIKREIQIQEDRNDKRFQRSTEWNMERRKDQEKLEERLRKVENDNAFDNGRSQK